MTNTDRYPLYIKIANIALAIFIFFYIMYIGQGIILPLVYSVIFAILLNPAVNWLCSKGMNRVVAILLSLMLALMLASGVIYFICSQLALFSDTLPQLKEKFGMLAKDTLRWVSDTFNVRSSKLNAWIEKAQTQGMDNSTVLIGSTLSTIGSVFSFIFLVPVYIFMILFYKPLLLNFIGMLFKREKHGTVVEVLTETKALIQSYLLGLMLEVVIVTAMNASALLLIGVEYAVLLGLIGALLNLIPYVGGLVGITLPVLMALATQSPEAAGWVFVAYIVIQLIDNNVVMPMIVASKVKINALVSIIVVLIGGAIWGVPGMFLSIPLTAIIKVIFDRIEPLQPWGFLLGDTMPAIGSTIFYFRKERKKPKNDKNDEA